MLRSAQELRARISDKFRANPWLEGVKYALTPCLVTIFLLRVVFSLYYIPSSSMSPTLKEGSVHLGWRLTYLISDPEPKRGDIVVFVRDSEPGKQLAKRVIGIGGDTVEIRESAVYVNGEKLPEPYLSESVATAPEAVYTVPEGKLFLLGDNRGDSFDSRYWSPPFVDVGRVHAIILF